jgi:hypothetical protein
VSSGWAILGGVNSAASGSYFRACFEDEIVLWPSAPC